MYIDEKGFNAITRQFLESILKISEQAKKLLKAEKELKTYRDKYEVEQKCESASKEKDLKPVETWGQNANYWKRCYDELYKSHCELQENYENVITKLKKAEKEAKVYKDKYEIEQKYAWILRNKLCSIQNWFEDNNMLVASDGIYNFLRDNQSPIWKRSVKKYREQVINSTPPNKEDVDQTLLELAEEQGFTYVPEEKPNFSEFVDKTLKKYGPFMKNQTYYEEYLKRMEELDE